MPKSLIFTACAIAKTRRASEPGDYLKLKSSMFTRGRLKK
jgi:hypothetical protein